MSEKKTPFELRFDTLCLARDILSENRHMAQERDRALREAFGHLEFKDGTLEVETTAEEVVLMGSDGKPTSIRMFPDRTFTVDEVLATAEKLYAFVLKTGQ